MGAADVEDGRARVAGLASGGETYWLNVDGAKDAEVQLPDGDLEDQADNTDVVQLALSENSW